MSGSVLSQPKASEIQAALFRFVDYLKAQKLFQTEKDWSVKLLRNTYNQKFKYAVSYSQLGLSSPFPNSPITDPILDFEALLEFGTRTGTIVVKSKTIEFPKHGIVVPKKDLQVEEHRQPPKQQKPAKPQQKPPKQDVKVAKQQIPKTLPVHPKKLYFISTKFINGFDRQLVGKTLEMVRPVLLYTLDTELTFDRPIKEFQFAGYQIFRQLMTDRGGIMVYVNKICEASYLEEFQNDQFESIWLKLYHPDLVIEEPTTEDAETSRPITIVGCVRGDVEEAAKSESFAYVSKCIKSVLSQYPDSNLVVISDIFSEPKTKLEVDPKVKSKIVRPMTSQPSPKSASYHCLWKTTHEDFNIGWERPLTSPHEQQVFCLTSVSRHFCNCCQISFLSSDAIQQHRSTYKHKKNFQAFVYQNNRSCELSQKFNLFLDISLPENNIASNNVSISTNADGVIVWKVEPGRINELILGLRNADDPADQKKDYRGRDLGIVLRSVEFLKNDVDFEMTDSEQSHFADKYGFTKPVEKRPSNVKPGIRIINGQILKIVIRVHKNEPGQFLAPIFVIFSKDSHDELAYMIKEILVKVSNEDVDLLQPTSVFVQPPRLTGKHWQQTGETVPGLKLDKTEHDGGMFIKASRKLDHYVLKPTLEKLLNSGFSQFAGMDMTLETMWRRYRSLLDSELSFSNYRERFALLLSCEEHQMQLDIRNYDMERVMMQEKGANLLSLEVPGLAENRPSVLKGDRIYIRVYGSDKSQEPEKKEYEGIVHEVENTRILVGFSPELRKRFLPKMRFDIRFTFNRFPIRNMHRAVDIIGRESGRFWLDMLFPDSDLWQRAARSNHTTIPTFYNKKIESNSQQKLAVEKIVSGGIPFVPYIIFGPPGTGKTVTIVEAIKQVWRHFPDARILSAAPSNAAADLLAERLIENIPKSQLLRIYAPSRNLRDVPEKLKSASNFINPAQSVDELKKYRILVVTLVTAGRMASADFPDGYFSHVFIDEAGHAQEPEAVIAVSGILSAGSKGQLILAGDPKQLGPILRSSIAIKYGLQLSLLERLMGRGIYERDKRTGAYNSNCITKLLWNFRSHAKLLELPSKMFYDSELVPKADPVLTESLLRWEGLPKSGFPMIFHGVVGEDKREERSPSFFNAEEAVIVVNYLEKLLTNKQKILPKDIGVISPYRRQVQKLRDLMNRRFQNKIANFKEVTVGSTEEFQGQERKVIIISTVRSQPELIRADFIHKLGFLKNPKRFNVAITRAKALLIVVGNPFLLCMDLCWKNLIHFAKENGGYTGVKFVLSDSIADSPELTQMEEKFRRMGLLSDDASDDLLDDNDSGTVVDISQKQYVEGLEWRAEI